MKSKVHALVGAQFGSEGKGVVSYELSKEYQVNVRTGAPNAGHTFMHEGRTYKMQTLPCGWPFPNNIMVLGAAALISPEILRREVEMAEAVCPDIRRRIFIDHNAGILESRHHLEEGGVGGDLHKRMGSTGEGVGAARRDRMARDPSKFRLAGMCHHEIGDLGIVMDTVEFLADTRRSGVGILLEGAQGFGLSLIHGDWPHVTTEDTTAAQLAANAGIPPHHVSEVTMVARTYPIRVAGPSGGLYNELSWEEMSRRVGRVVEERTTVTKKVRRIGEWDEDLYRRAVQANAPHNIALTFMDYYSPEDAGKTREGELSQKASQFISYIESAFPSGRVSFVGTGFDEQNGWKFVDRRF